MIGFDPLYLIITLPAIILALYAQFKVKSSFKKASKIRAISGMTGAEAARKILDLNGLSNVEIQRVSGFLGDHYDPTKKVLRLSPDVHDEVSLAAIGVAAHEAGHAIQDKEKYSLLVFRNAIVPLASFGSNASFFLIFIGAMMSSMGLIKLGVIAYSMIVLFQLVNLPVEFNASSRAKALLFQNGIVYGDEAKTVSNVLSSAAMTYVAATISALLTLVYYLIRLGVLGGRNDD